MLEAGNHSVAVDEMSTEKWFSVLDRGNKWWLQAIKKFYGCLAYGTDICYAMDSEGKVLRNTICHAASVYLKQKLKPVFTVPYPYPYGLATGHDKPVEISRSLLGGVRGEEFGEFYAMTSYHWIWPV